MEINNDYEIYRTGLKLWNQLKALNEDQNNEDTELLVE